MSQNMILQSPDAGSLPRDANATSLPSGENAMAPFESFKWMSSVCRVSPVIEFQSLTVRSQDKDATSLPSGEKATATTACEWPSSVRRSAPVVESQSLTVLSLD